MAWMQRLNEWSGDSDAAELSRELRLDSGGFLKERRRVTALSLVSIGAMGVIALYQMGVIPHLPEPPIPGLDADEVDASEEAYAKLHTPDAVIGLRSYATTLALTAMGGADRARDRPWIPLALAGKALFDAAQAAKLTVDQWTKHRTFCSYCLVASAATFAVLPLVLPEAEEAWKHLELP